MRRLALLAPLLTFALAWPARGEPKETPKTLQAGSWTLTWTSKSGKATGPQGRTVVLWEQPKPEPDCAEETIDGAVLSVVGTIVSMDLSRYSDCGGAHPSSWRTYEVLDLTQPSRRLSLYDFFDKSEVQRVMNADPFLRKAKTREDAECEFTLEGFEKSFAFHHVEGNKVAVRVGLTHGCEAMRGHLTQLGLLLTPKPDFLTRLRAAEQAGTLMKSVATGKK